MKAIKRFVKELLCNHEWTAPHWDLKCRKCGKLKIGVYR